MTTATGECAIVPRRSKMPTATGMCATVHRLFTITATGECAFIIVPRVFIKLQLQENVPLCTGFLKSQLQENVPLCPGLVKCQQLQENVPLCPGFLKSQLQENVPLCPGLVKMTTATGECAIVSRLFKNYSYRRTYHCAQA